MMVEEKIIEAAKKYARDCGSIWDSEGWALEEFKKALAEIMATAKPCD